MPVIKRRLIKGIVSVIGAFLLHFTYGHFYTLANMAPYIMGFLRSRTDNNLEASQAIWLSALALGIQGISVPLGGFVARKFGYRLVLVISCLMESGGIMLTHFTIQKSFLATVLSYSLMKGAGFSFGYSVALAVASAWFPERKGLVMGIIVGGFGLGSLIFTPIQTAFINPHNIPVDNATRQFTDERVLEKVPSVFLLLGTVLLSIQCIALCMIRKEKPTANAAATDKNEQSGTAGTTGTAATSGKQTPTPQPPTSSTNPSKPLEKNLTPKYVIRRLDFYLLWLVMFCSIIPITLITASYKYFGQVFISDDQFLTAVATSSAVFNFGGRIMWGSLVDRFSFKLPFCALFITWAALLLTFPHLAATSGIAAKILYTIWVCSIFVCLSGIFSIMPVATSILFGQANLAINYGLIYPAFSFGGLLSALINSLLAKQQSYVNQYTASGIVCLCALFIVLWIDDEKIPAKYDYFKVFTTKCPRARGKTPDPKA